MDAMVTTALAAIAESWARYKAILPDWLPAWAAPGAFVALIAWSGLQATIGFGESVKRVLRFFGVRFKDDSATVGDLEKQAEKQAPAAAEQEKRQKEEAERRHAETQAKLDALLSAREGQGGAPLDPATKEAFDKATAEILQSGDARAQKALELLASGDSDQAVAQLKQLAEDRARAARDQTAKAAAEYQRLGALTAPFDTYAAKAAYEAALALAPDDLEARNELGHLLRRLGDLAEAEAAYEAVLAGAKGDRWVEAAALGNLGNIALTRGDVAAAEGFHKRALAVFEALGGKQGMANALTNLGVIAGARGELAAAEDYIKRALAVFEALGGKQDMATALGNLGNIAWTRGDLDAAEACQQRALALHEALGRKEGMAANLGNLGAIAQTRGDLDGSEGYQKRALALNEALGSKEGTANALNNLGLIAATRGDPKKARDFFQPGPRALRGNGRRGERERAARAPEPWQAPARLRWLAVQLQSFLPTIVPFKPSPGWNRPHKRSACPGGRS